MRWLEPQSNLGQILEHVAPNLHREEIPLHRLDVRGRCLNHLNPRTKVDVEDKFAPVDDICQGLAGIEHPSAFVETVDMKKPRRPGRHHDAGREKPSEKARSAVIGSRMPGPVIVSAYLETCVACPGAMIDIRIEDRSPRSGA